MCRRSHRSHGRWRSGRPNGRVRRPVPPAYSAPGWLERERRSEERRNGPSGQHAARSAWAGCWGAIPWDLARGERPPARRRRCRKTRPGQTSAGESCYYSAARLSPVRIIARSLIVATTGGAELAQIIEIAGQHLAIAAPDAVSLCEVLQ